MLIHLFLVVLVEQIHSEPLPNAHAKVWIYSTTHPWRQCNGSCRHLVTHSDNNCNHCMIAARHWRYISSRLRLSVT
ncbi:hypothetical protein EDB19DRAFT_1754032 [Suillus lakei]|nr:hypothetical protein EDB19DRAFT_1754032 [Suillus lakei]